MNTFVAREQTTENPLVEHAQGKMQATVKEMKTKQAMSFKAKRQSVYFELKRVSEEKSKVH